MTIPEIDWRHEFNSLGGVYAAGYLGALSDPLFMYERASGAAYYDDKPWRLLCTLPGYAGIRWPFEFELEARLHAVNVLTTWMSAVNS